MSLSLSRRLQDYGHRFQFVVPWMLAEVGTNGPTGKGVNACKLQ